MIACVGEGLYELGLAEGSDEAVAGMGGDVANVAVMAARMGSPVRLGARVGDDPLGRRLVEFWRRNEVDVEFVRTDPTAVTGAYVNELGPEGHAFTYLRRDSAGSRLEVDDLPDAFLHGVRTLHYSGITLAVSASSAAAALDAARRTHAAGGLVSFAVNHRPTLRPDLPTLRQVACAADLLFASREEWALLFDDDELARVAADFGIAEIVVTDGSDGATVYDAAGDELVDVPARAVEAVDSAGAGDGLTGAYLAGRLDGLAPREALQRAVIAAALACGRRGCSASYPARAEVDAAMAGRHDRRSEVIDAIAEQRIVPVLRAPSVEDAIETARVLAGAGARVIELTRSTPDVEQAVAVLAAEGLIVGVGTIRRSEEIASAAAAGARFVVSFATPPGFVATARAAGLLPIPGALTPSEIAANAADGAEVVKLFPARLAEPAYLRDLAPLVPGVRFVVTGGIEPGAIPEWLAAGALAVGLGGGLGTVATVGAAAVEERWRDAARRTS